MLRKPTPVDHAIGFFDNALQTLSGQYKTTGRANPSDNLPEETLSHDEKRHIAALMRINHVGEVCAQGLYQGQSATAKLPDVRDAMQKAAEEENDHLDWCHTRLNELDSRTSYLNPFWYLGSFSLGALAGLAGDKWSLGFVAETEKQVVAHLDSHLEQLPEHDKKSRHVLETMKDDELKHATQAMAAGGAELPLPVKTLMKGFAKVMTKTAYYI